MFFMLAINGPICYTQAETETNFAKNLIYDIVIICYLLPSL